MPCPSLSCPLDDGDARRSEPGAWNSPLWAGMVNGALIVLPLWLLILRSLRIL